METLSQLDTLIKDIETKPLSEVIPRVMVLAIECKDYKGYCVLSHFIRPISNNAQSNQIQDNEIILMLLMQGLAQKDIALILQESIKEYIELKSISAEEISSHSVKEIETWLEQAKMALDSPTQSSKNSYTSLANRTAQIRQLYESLRGYVISKLVLYSQMQKMIGAKPNIETNTPIQFHQKVFVVHGHNGEMKEAIARILENQGIQALILHEQVNQGATIIEKIERNSDVGCAICIFTADDLGRAKNDIDEKTRARQNVVFEAGYFIGKLGRERVILIADPCIEIPSDLQGVVYTDSANWRFSILKELKSMGYTVDYNKLD